jgi:hypothetical protein
VLSLAKWKSVILAHLKIAPRLRREHEGHSSGYPPRQLASEAGSLRLCSCRRARLSPAPSVVYSVQRLSRDLLVLQKMIECLANDLVAFARRGFQPLAVDDLDSSALIPYEVPRLQRLCDHCHARAAQP